MIDVLLTPEVQLDNGDAFWRAIELQISIYQMRLTELARSLYRLIETSTTHSLMLGKLVKRSWPVSTKDDIQFCIFKIKNYKDGINLHLHMISVYEGCFVLHQQKPLTSEAGSKLRIRAAGCHQLLRTRVDVSMK